MITWPVPHHCPTRAYDVLRDSAKLYLVSRPASTRRTCCQSCSPSQFNILGGTSPQTDINHEDLSSRCSTIGTPSPPVPTWHRRLAPGSLQAQSARRGDARAVWALCYGSHCTKMHGGVVFGTALCRSSCHLHPSCSVLSTPGRTPNVKRRSPFNTSNAAEILSCLATPSSIRSCAISSCSALPGGKTS